VREAKYLHQRTGGMIGSLAHLIRGAPRSDPGKSYSTAPALNAFDDVISRFPGDSPLPQPTQAKAALGQVAPFTG
jgi:hypothetical protein